MSDTQKLAGAAAAIAEALGPLTPEQRVVVMKMAEMLCPAEPVKPARAPRRDKGVPRKANEAQTTLPEVQ